MYDRLLPVSAPKMPVVLTAAAWLSLGLRVTSVGCLWHLTINWLCCLWPDSPVVASEDAGIFQAPVAPAEELSA